jgi:hypothetical protein
MTIDSAINNLVTRVKVLESEYDTLNNRTELEKLQALVTKHYTGAISIGDYYKVGDIISGVSLKNGTALNEIVDLVVIGIEHDTINGSSTKAALTLSQVNSLSNKKVMNSSYSDYTYAKYSTSAMRTWINNTYYNALPSGLQSLIKTVDKTTNEPQSSSTVSSVVSSTEKCFLPSCYEMFGSGYNSHFTSSDGTQYEYYKTTNNRVKYYGRNGTSGSWWWTRSGFVNSYGSANFVFVGSDGSACSDSASNGGGVCPAFCI